MFPVGAMSGFLTLSQAPLTHRIAQRTLICSDEVVEVARKNVVKENLLKCLVFVRALTRRIEGRGRRVAANAVS
ncbi:hypothetical protein T440DRAFT_464671 [Plenodomus tracheiphilus IPT5]|uniref:Uncharacterized protein n=1 Tax=Plenodomus tracheiphilus IPT5 TaxID=1408161 RepID=A0A6A7BGM9_9PLEO|nr:hypothetical protein T440DRAFT_464671 [Plenodomus tracheiphilus IPT5]